MRCLLSLILPLPIALPDESLLAQTSAGRIIGTITDQGGAAIPGATVTLVIRDFGIETKEATQASGYFTFLNVRPGAYTMNVAASGFARVGIAPFVVEVNQTVSRDAILAVGALQMQFDRRFAKGFKALVSYTRSKSIDTGSSGYGNESGPGGSSAVQDPRHPENDRSVSSYDIPHFFTASVNWEPPIGRGKALLAHGPASYILGNWQTNLLMPLRSGQPYNLQVAGDVGNIGQFNSGYNYARPNLIGDPHVDNPTADRWFNPAAFSIPQFSFGNFGRNVLRSSHVSNVDFAVFKAVREPGAVELRVETFNIFNIQNYAPPSGLVIGPSSAGRVTATATTPRSYSTGAQNPVLRALVN